MNQERWTEVDRYLTDLFAPHDPALEEALRAFAAFLHVVMAELDEQVIAFFHGAQDLLQALGGEGTPQGLAGLRMVGDRHARLEEPRQHLPPAVPRLARLVALGGIAQDVDRDGILGPRDFQGAKAGARVVEFQGQLLVPVQKLRRLLAVLEPDLPAGGDPGSADVDREGPRLELSRVGRHFLPGIELAAPAPDVIAFGGRSPPWRAPRKEAKKTESR